MLPKTAYLVIGVYMHAAIPAVPQWGWILLSIVVVTGLNALGVHILSPASNAIVAAQVVFVALFIVLASMTAAGWDFPSVPEAVFGNDASLGLLFAGAAILCYSFLGFDAVSSLSEETRNAQRTIPRAIMLVTLLGGILFIIVSAVSNLAVADWTSYSSPDAAANDVTFTVGGQWFEVFFTAAFVAGCVGAVTAQQATATRLLYSMGRDGVLPRRVFGVLHPKWHTPVRATLVISAIALISTFIDLAFDTTMISFGALAAFSLMNLSVIKHFWIDRRRRNAGGTLRFLILPAVGLALWLWLWLWLWSSLSLAALLIGVAWVALGFVCRIRLTRGFKQSPPELTMDDAAA